MVIVVQNYLLLGQISCFTLNYSNGSHVAQTICRRDEASFFFKKYTQL